MSFDAVFTRMANVVSRWAGRPAIFTIAVILVVIWALTGPIFDYSETWQLIINTGTTIITFLMVFLIQNTQNRDNAALHSKLDEMIRAGESKNKFIGIETLPEEKIVELHEEIQTEIHAAEKIDGAIDDDDRVAARPAE